MRQQLWRVQLLSLAWGCGSMDGPVIVASMGDQFCSAFTVQWMVQLLQVYAWGTKCDSMEGPVIVAKRGDQMWQCAV